MTEWVLAFDAGCSACVDVVGRVRAVAGDRIEVAGLGEERIQGLRRRAMGERPAWVPTLLAVDGDDVRAWTGPRLSVRLARLLGPVRAMRLVRGLSNADIVVNANRRRLLRAVPTVAAGAFLVSGGLAAPAMADGKKPVSTAQKWARANRGKLPTRYDDVVAYPVQYRRAIFAELTPADRAKLWADHLDRYRAARSGLTAEQSTVLDTARTVLRKVHTADRGHQPYAAELDGLRKSAIQAFGEDEARALLTRLGPADTKRAAAAPDCSCASYDDWCGDGTYCNGVWVFGDCVRSSIGCGSGWTYPCDGLCQPV